MSDTHEHRLDGTRSQNFGIASLQRLYALDQLGRLDDLGNATYGSDDLRGLTRRQVAIGSGLHDSTGLLGQRATGGQVQRGGQLHGSQSRVQTIKDDPRNIFERNVPPNGAAFGA